MAALYHSELGRGAPLIFVHGSLEDYRSWRRQMAPFAERYHVVAYSRRHHYPNPVRDIAADHSAALHAQDLAALIDGMALAPVHLVASSFGGYISLYLAAQRPELVRTLVLGEPPLLPWLEQTPDGAPLAAAFRACAWEPACRAFREGNPQAGIRSFMNGVIGPGAFEHMTRGSLAMVMANAPAMQAETQATGYFTPFTCADATAIAQPALLLEGEFSPLMFHMITDKLARCLPNHAARAVIPGTSHAMHLGNPQAYNETVLAFLDRYSVS